MKKIDIEGFDLIHTIDSGLPYYILVDANMKYIFDKHIFWLFIVDLEKNEYYRITIEKEPQNLDNFQGELKPILKFIENNKNLLFLFANDCISFFEFNDLITK